MTELDDVVGLNGSRTRAPTASARRKEFVAGSAMSFGVGIATSAIGLLSGIVAAETLGPGGRGRVALMQIVIAASVVLGSLGLPDAIIYFAKSQALHVRTLYDRFERLALAGGALMSAVAMCVCFALWKALGLNDAGTALLYCFAVLPNALMLLVGGALRSAGRSIAWNGTRVVGAGCWLLALLAPHGGSVRAVILIHTALLMLSWLGLRRLVRNDGEPHSHVPPTIDGAALRYGAPSALIGLPALLNGKVDQIVVAGAKSVDAAGVYAAAAGLAAGAFLLPQSVALILFPAVASGQMSSQTRRIVRYGLPACAAFGASYGLAGYLAWPLLFGPLFSAGRTPAVILSIAWAIAGFNSMLEETLRGLGRSRLPLLTQCISAVSTIAFTFSLTRLFDITGAAAGSLAGFGAGTIALLVTMARLRSGAPAARH